MTYNSLIIFLASNGDSWEVVKRTIKIHSTPKHKGFQGTIYHAQMQAEGFSTFPKGAGCYTCLLPTQVCQNSGEESGECFLSPPILWVFFYEAGLMGPSWEWFWKKYTEPRGRTRESPSSKNWHGLGTLDRSSFRTGSLWGVVVFFLWCKDYVGDI